MKILISNDDGIRAEGIKVLVEALKPLGEIVVVAPDKQQTAKGHSMSFDPVRVEKVMFDEQIEGYSVEGTPKDCVDIALSTIYPGEIDLVATGINHGPNLCNDCVSSGTIGGAMAGYLRGIPSIAFSLDNGPVYDYGRWISEIREITGWFVNLEDKLDYLLNVNLPNRNEFKGTVIADTGGIHDFPAPYTVTEREDGTYYQVPFGIYRSVSRINDLEHDMYALDQGYIVINPLDYDLVRKDRLSSLRARWSDRDRKGKQL